MKRILCLLLCLMLPISALALSAASVVADVLQNAADENPIDGVERVYLYGEEDNLIILGMASDTFNQAAVLASEDGMRDAYDTVKAVAYGQWEYMRAVLDSVGCEDTAAWVQLRTGFEDENTVYYAIGDAGDGVCALLLDAITGDTALIGQEAPAATEAPEGIADLEEASAEPLEREATLEALLTVADAVEDVNTTVETIQRDGYDIDRFRQGIAFDDAKTAVMVFSQDGEVQAVAVRCDAFPNDTIEKNYAAVRDFVADLIGLPAGWESGEIDTETRIYEGAYFYICAPGFPAEDYAALSFFGLDSILGTDEALEKIEALAVDLDFSALMDLCAEYPNDPTAQAIAQQAETADNLLKNCVVEDDVFTDTFTVYAKGCQEITKAMCLVPYIKDYGFGIGAMCRVGYIADSWVFFDDILVAGDGMETIKMHIEPEYSEVLSNGTVTEVADVPFTVDDAQAILAAGDVAIRFQGEGRKLDVEVSQAELDAMATIYGIDAAVTEIIRLANQK